MNKIHFRGDFEAEPAAGQVVFDVIYDGSRFLLEDGSPLPRLAPGARVRMRMNAGGVLDEAWRAAVSRSLTIELLPAGQLLYALADLRGLNDRLLVKGPPEPGLLWLVEKAQAAKRDVRLDLSEQIQWYDGLVALRLLEPLLMERRGDKPFRLQHCACEVYDLDEEPRRFFSLNQALLKISERIEVHRSTHAGNVFRRIVVPHAPHQPGSVLVPAVTGVRLGRLRERIEEEERLRASSR